jgi:hypothetical protein
VKLQKPILGTLLSSSTSILFTVFIALTLNTSASASFYFLTFAVYSNIASVVMSLLFSIIANLGFSKGSFSLEIIKVFVVLFSFQLLASTLFLIWSYRSWSQTSDFQFGLFLYLIVFVLSQVQMISLFLTGLINASGWKVWPNAAHAFPYLFGILSYSVEDNLIVLFLGNLIGFSLIVLFYTLYLKNKFYFRKTGVGMISLTPSFILGAFQYGLLSIVPIFAKLNLGDVLGKDQAIYAYAEKITLLFAVFFSGQISHSLILYQSSGESNDLAFEEPGFAVKRLTRLFRFLLLITITLIFFLGTRVLDFLTFNLIDSRQIVSTSMVLLLYILVAFESNMHTNFMFARQMQLLQFKLGIAHALGLFLLIFLLSPLSAFSLASLLLIWTFISFLFKLYVNSSRFTPAKKYIIREAKSAILFFSLTTLLCFFFLDRLNILNFW